ncbi:ribosomal protein S7 [Acrasis kona]|uniref:40S ribosomal protein S7 n=1 Tax=Acrasis kona TaxID=1008807 RepID=A0AAW2YLB9_9EUKA
MLTALRKIHKSKDQTPDELETQIAQAIFDLEVNNKDLKAELQPLTFSSAKEVKVGKDKSAIIVFVPVRQIQAWKKVQGRLVRELEKKFSGKTILMVGQRKALSKPTSNKVHRPRARNLAEVQERLMEDVAHPVEIVGRRTRFRTDGGQHIRIFLDSKEKNNFESKLHTLSVVYRMLTGKRVTYEFQPTA